MGFGDCLIRSYDVKLGDVKKVFVGYDFVVIVFEVIIVYVMKCMLGKIVNV